MSQERREVGLRRTEFNFGRATSFAHGKRYPTAKIEFCTSEPVLFERADT